MKEAVGSTACEEKEQVNGVEVAAETEATPKAPTDLGAEAKAQGLPVAEPETEKEIFLYHVRGK